MNCDQLQSEMGEWIGSEGRMPPEAQLHFQGCRDCAQAWEALQEFERIARSEALPEPEEIFWQRQRAAILEGVRKSPGRFRIPSWAWAFPLLFIALWIGFASKPPRPIDGGSEPLSWFLEEEDLPTPELNEEEEEIYISYLSQKKNELEEEENSLEDYIDQFDSEQLQKAIQKFESENKRRVL